MTDSNREEKKSDCTNQLVKVHKPLEAHAITQKGICLVWQLKKTCPLYSEKLCTVEQEGRGWRRHLPQGQLRGVRGGSATACGGAARQDGEREMEHASAWREGFPRPPELAPSTAVCGVWECSYLQISSGACVEELCHYIPPSGQVGNFLLQLLVFTDLRQPMKRLVLGFPGSVCTDMFN